MNYNIRALKDSLYSSQFYRQTAAIRSDNGFAFLALIALIHTLFILITLAAVMFIISAKEIDAFIDQTPRVTIQNGELSINEPSPYNIKAANKTIAVIDTENFNDKSTEDIFKVMQQGDWYALATKTKIYTHKENGKYEVYDLSEKTSNKAVTFDKNDVHKWAKICSIIFLPLMAVFTFLAIWLYKIIQMLIYSVIGIIINSLLGRNLSYSTIQRLVSYCLWPPTLLVIVLGFAHFHVMTLISIIVTIAYIYFAIKSSDSRIAPLVV